MKILLIGYGKMGKAVEEVACQRGHQLVHKIDSANRTALDDLDPTTVDLAIEFSQPAAAYDNIYQCLSKNIPVISGTTGWLDRKETLETYCKEQQGTFFYAANFSVGMNIMFQVNALLAKLMRQHAEYHVEIKEVHHVEKRDRPSGTAITLAQDIIHHLPHKKHWRLAPTQQADAVPIVATRTKDVPGMHTVVYTSAADTLALKHTAHNRKSFALGAVLVAEWILGKQGVLGMEDFLKLNSP